MTENNPGKRDISDDNPEIPREDIEPSFITELFGDATPFRYREETLTDPAQKEFGMRKDETGSLVFDTDFLDGAETEFIKRFVAMYEDGTLMDSPTGWYFAEETAEFMEELVKILKAKLEGKTTDSLKNLDLNKKLKGAVDSMRDMARRAEIKKALDKQFEDLPFALYIDENGQPIPKENIDYIYVNTPDGPELLISTKNTTRRIVKITTYPLSQITDTKKFSIASVEKRVDNKPSSKSGNQTHFEIKIEQGAALTSPIFSTIRIITEPIDLNKEIDKLIKEKEAAEEAERQRQQKQTSYAPNPPAARSSSTPRYQQDTTYIRSG